MEAAKFTLEGDKNKAKVIDCLGISGGQSAQHVLREFKSGVATLLILCAGLTCRLTVRVQLTYGLYLVPAGLTTSVSTAMGHNLSALCRSVGTTLVKEPYWGQINFHRFIWLGVVCPLFYLQIFLRTSINSQKIITTFSLVTLKTQ